VTRYGALPRLLPRFLRRWVLDFEARIDGAVLAFAAALPDDARVLDAGAGEARHASYFQRQRYTAVDLAVGDAQWDYSRLDAVADLAALPFPTGCFDACVNIVTLEHVPDPARAVSEMARVLGQGGRLLLVVPHEWEVHQAPYDYFRFTTYGVEHLLKCAGFTEISIQPAGGLFRLLARRLLNSLQFFPPLLFPIALLLAAPPALLLPLLDFLDRRRIFTLGYVCTARRRC